MRKQRRKTRIDFGAESAGFIAEAFDWKEQPEHVEYAGAFYVAY
jgi:hypothetical protein